MSKKSKADKKASKKSKIPASTMEALTSATDNWPLPPSKKAKKPKDLNYGVYFSTEKPVVRFENQLDNPMGFLSDPQFKATISSYSTREPGTLTEVAGSAIASALPATSPTVSMIGERA